MADPSPPPLAWVKDARGAPRGFHATCAKWLKLEAADFSREPYHTEICLCCGRFLTNAPSDLHGPPNIDPKILLS